MYFTIGMAPDIAKNQFLDLGFRFSSYKQLLDLFTFLHLERR